MTQREVLRIAQVVCPCGPLLDLSAAGPKPSSSEFCTTTVEQRCSAFDIKASFFREAMGSQVSATSCCNAGGRER
jgi:hypothetical protein